LEVGVRLRHRQRDSRARLRRPHSDRHDCDTAAAGSRTFAELLIDAEEDKYLLAVLVGMLREQSR
jgi:hypothetical protein